MFVESSDSSVLQHCRSWLRPTCIISISYLWTYAYSIISISYTGWQETIFFENVDIHRPRTGYTSTRWTLNVSSRKYQCESFLGINIQLSHAEFKSHFNGPYTAKLKDCNLLELCEGRANNMIWLLTLTLDVTLHIIHLVLNLNM